MNKTVFIVIVVVVLVLGISAITFTFKECGWKTLLLGNGGFYAATMGLCDD
jgi:hypothetical protein